MQRNYFFLIFTAFLLSYVWLVAYNVLRLGECGDLHAQMFSLAKMYNRNTNVQFNPNAPLSPNRCYLPFLFFLSE